ncbi:MAG: RagB/SusD family nutrient uptake outer membrane protein [Marinifilaceae bacterium]|jgi:tetratricopeptide (TPR) repeat protein|nr:RagB/SusD family nutrient uptake outer membrane protein [Marinifilaceae bacterium]
MRRILTILFISILFCSCDDFLEEKSQDEIVPTTVNDYKDFLYGQAYIKDDYLGGYFTLFMTDDVNEFFYVKDVTDYRPGYFGHYTWQKNIENSNIVVVSSHKNADDIIVGEDREYNNNRPDLSYERYYKQIMACNIVIANIDEAEDGTQAQKDDVKGEALFLRANAYFNLVNLYGLPYKKDLADQLMGVPINDDIYITSKLRERSSVADVYKKISEDIKLSCQLLESSNITKSVFRVSANAAFILASRVYVYMQEWDLAIEYANKAIDKNSSLCDLNTYDEDNFMDLANPEIVFTFGSVSTDHFYFKNHGFKASDELVAMFKDSDYDGSEDAADNDMRLKKWFKSYKYQYLPIKQKTVQARNYAIRSAEAYLNRAEAYYHKDKYDLAVEDVVVVLENRMKVMPDYDALKTKEKALDFVLSERRKELCYEMHRWYDLRRLGGKEIVHEWSTGIGADVKKQKYTLKADDPAYTLALPNEVAKLNSTIQKWIRPERTAEDVAAAVD